jgi:hypothetical protein
MDRRPHANGCERGAMSTGLWRRTCATLVLAWLATSGCVGDVAPEVAQAPYPNLHDVPTRPTADFTLAERQQILRALERDRDVAAWDRQAARADLGRGAPPAGPRPEPLAQPAVRPEGVTALPLPPVPGPLPPGGGYVADLVVRRQVTVERNTGRLTNFLRILEEQSQLNRQLEQAGLGTLPDPIPGGPGAPDADPIARVAFARDSSEPPDEVDPVLRTAIATAARERARLAVVGTGTPSGVALNRARAVAARLMRLGAPTGMLTMRLGGSGDAVTLHLLGPGTFRPVAG